MSAMARGGKKVFSELAAVPQSRRRQQRADEWAEQRNYKQEWLSHLFLFLGTRGLRRDRLLRKRAAVAVRAVCADPLRQTSLVLMSHSITKLLDKWRWPKMELDGTTETGSAQQNELITCRQTKGYPHIHAWFNSMDSLLAMFLHHSQLTPARLCAACWREG